MKGLEYRDLQGILLQIEKRLPPHKNWTGRSLALLLLQGDGDLLQYLKGEMEEEAFGDLASYLETLSQEKLVSSVHRERYCWAQELGRKATIDFRPIAERTVHPLDELTTHPLTGLLLLSLLLYLGLYYLVGVFGAGWLVDLLEGRLFQGHINPFLVAFFQEHLPWPLLQDLFIGQYGIITLGLRYAFGIILPVVGCFFLFFSFLEDTGYLPRIGLLLDRLFKLFGLGGQAVIPIILGFGCATMATLTTRVLKSERERIIATFLLSLAVPCSAQLGVISGLLSQEPFFLFLWGGVMLMVFFVSGRILTGLLPGEASSFLVEIPVLRWPRMANILMKTLSRMQWYVLEILPVFVVGSVFIWFLRLIGLFPLLLRPLEGVMGWMGLPPATAGAFFFGFFRRDYGAAGLYDLYGEGILTGDSLLVAAVSLTLFVPCIAQVLVNIQERGLPVALLILAAILPLAFFTGYLLHHILSLFSLGFGA